PARRAGVAFAWQPPRHILPRRCQSRFRTTRFRMRPVFRTGPPVENAGGLPPPGTVVAPGRRDPPMTDGRQAVRARRESPGFSFVAVLTIAVGIGANTALFSVYDRLVLNPVTIPAPSSLVAIWVNNPQLNFNAPAMSWPRYEDTRDHATSFAAVGIS